MGIFNFRGVLAGEGPVKLVLTLEGEIEVLRLNEQLLVLALSGRDGPGFLNR